MVPIEEKSVNSNKLEQHYNKETHVTNNKEMSQIMTRAFETLLKKRISTVRRDPTSSLHFVVV
jgi:hypothetical protein